MPYGINPITGKPGPCPKPPRDGDKRQARQRINVQVKTGYIPNPNSLSCVDCGHFGGDRRHEYDHYLGYEAENHSRVQPACTLCHAKRDSQKVRKTHCVNSHDFTAANTIIKTNGCRQCRECRKAYDRNRRNRT